MSGTLLFIFGLGGVEILLIILIPVLLWFWSLIDCLKGEFKNYDKIVWMLLIILVPAIGPILYLIMGRRQKI